MDDFRRSARAVLGATSWDIEEGEDSEDTRFDPIAALLSIRLSAPTVRSKYDPFQVCTDIFQVRRPSGAHLAVP